MVRFTVAFKEEFWRRYTEECQSPRKIMEELGFDPEMLGQRRIDSILTHLRDQVQLGEEFRDVRKVSESQAGTDEKSLPPSKAILKMQHKIAYLEQEMEFVKKIILADRKAGQIG
jgi:hypothetical protein